MTAIPMIFKQFFIHSRSPNINEVFSTSRYRLDKSLVPVHLAAPMRHVVARVKDPNMLWRANDSLQVLSAGRILRTAGSPSDDPKIHYLREGFTGLRELRGIN
jgi:hypothetical protein